MNLKEDPSQIKLSIHSALVEIMHAARARPYEVVRHKQWPSELSGPVIQWGPDPITTMWKCVFSTLVFCFKKNFSMGGGPHL